MRRSRLVLLLVLGMLSAILPIGAAAPALAAAAPGDLVITEVMQNPSAVSDGDGEWFEIQNVSGSPIDLDGWTIEDNDFDSHVIAGTLVVAAGAYVVLGINADTATNGGVTVDYAYGSGFSLANGGDELVLVAADATEFDRIEWDGGAVWPDPTGASMSLDPTKVDTTSNDDGANWCEGSTAYGAGDLGTPGAANDSCDPAAAAPGDLVITEVMQNPSAVSDGDGEWFEIQNVSGSPIDLDGWTIEDNDFDSHVIVGSLVVAAGDYVVLGNNADTGTNGGVTVDYSYGGDMFLSNGADELILDSSDATEFDRIEWDGGAVWPDPTGASMNLDPTKVDTTLNDDGANWCEGSSVYGAGDRGTPGSENDSCAPAFAYIHEIQGSGSSVAISGPVTTLGIVTSFFERDDAVDGFFIQTPDAFVDADPATSEGIFVFCRGNCPNGLGTGDLVTVTGSAGENFGMSQVNVTAGTVIVDSAGNTLPVATPVDLPAAASTVAEDTFENLEGMVVTFRDTLVVSEYFQLARFGQIVLTESSRPFQFTHDNAPSVAGYAAFLDDLATRRIILDDDNNDNNDAISDGPDEPYYYPTDGLSLTNKFRGGDTITDLTGVMHWSWAGAGGTDAWRIRPIVEVQYTFESVNPEPGSPADVGGSLQVASFNVLNYFTTVDLGPNVCGPTGGQDCRGADSEAERIRQRDKIVSAMDELDAEVLGLIELQNDTDDASIADLVAGLNDAAGAGTYEYVPTGAIGDDAIKVGLIYKPDAVTLDGGFAILDSSVDPTFLDDKNRPVLIQTFVENETGENFTVAVNHFKSKGSDCDSLGDPDTGDGQANCAGTRTAAATALASYLATDPTSSGDLDFLIIGDLNSYAMEDPITALKVAGYTDLLEAFHGPGVYSYVFDGQLGYLDYALANESLLPRITGVTAWNINADEVNVFDYNDDIRDEFGEASFERESGVLPIYADDALRSSDHDPVLVGLNLADPQGDKEDVVAELEGLLPTGDKKTDRRLSAAVGYINDSLNGDWWTSDQTIITKKVFDFERQAIAQLELVAASDVPEAGAAQSAIDVLVNADRQLAQIELIAAIDRGGKSSKIADAQAAMAEAAEYAALGLYNDAVNAYKSAWDAAHKA